MIVIVAYNTEMHNSVFTECSQKHSYRGRYKIKLDSKPRHKLKNSFYPLLKVSMRPFLFCALALSCFVSAYAESIEEKEPCPDGKRHYRATVRHIESGGIGYKDGYTTLETFIASDPGWWRVTPFFDARGHIFNNGKWAANVGTGIRALWKERAYGINAYYDYRKTSRFHSNQIGVGLETLGKILDFRINGYLPVGKKVSKPYHTAFKTFSGNHMLLSQKFQTAMKGADAELGFHCGKFKSFDFYAAAGPYYFTGEKTRAVWGGKARVAGMFKDILTLEISDSYDRTFHNKVQAQISLTYSFGPKSKIKEKGRTCKVANMLNDRMLQPVARQEIIVFDTVRKNAVAMDPSTGLPYFFVFVNNTSSSNGTYKSPYPTLALAQDNSSPNDIIYVFPGDGTTKGMDSGIFLKANQKFWGSGISHSLQTAQGTISIPAQSSSPPTITNTNFDTEGNVITLGTNNAISGFVITSALNDAIYGIDQQSLDVSSCIIENTSTFAIDATFPGNASISITDNQFLNNVNGVFLTLNGTSSVDCSNNLFSGQTSVSNVPIEITANSNTLATRIENNVFDHNTTGTLRFNFTSVVNADLAVLNNTITNNQTGFQSSLGSSFVIIATGTTDHCAIDLQGNTFSGNTSNALYLHTSGTFANLEATIHQNTMSNNGGSALVFATPTNVLDLVATNNTIVGNNDNGIAVISSGLTSSGNIVINNNTITDIGNASNGIAINQDFTILNLTILNNAINQCAGTGILSYAPSGIGNLAMNISGNTISNCENMSSNAASGLDIEQFTNFVGSVTNNTLSDNVGLGVMIGSTLMSPNACLTLTGNSSSTDYLLSNPGGGLFNLSPCNVDSVNTGTINTSGTIDLVESCTDRTACVP